MPKRTKPKPKRESRTIYINRDDLAILNRIVEQTEHSFAAVVRDIIRAYVNGIRHGAKR